MTFQKKSKPSSGSINPTAFCIMVGILLVLLYHLPYFILGENSTFRIVDFLDDEVVQYTYNTKYLFSPSDTIVEEWMGGVPVATIQPPCFLLVFFFKYLSLFRALVTISILGKIAAFSGMFLLCDTLLFNEKKYISMMAGFLFSILPNYPLYGMSSMGIPLVIWTYIKIHKIICESGDRSAWYCIKKCLPLYLLCIVYALSSSLVWAGYFVVGFAVLFTIPLLFKKRKSAPYLLAASALITATYCFTFYNTIKTEEAHV